MIFVRFYLSILLHFVSNKLDNDDDGEDAAGGRLLHLLQILDAKNVLVIVSRWYGGIKLGPGKLDYHYLLFVLCSNILTIVGYL